MKAERRVVVAMLSCVILMGATGALGQNWPQWRGPDRDGKVTGFTAPQTWPATLTQKWKVTVGPGDATPALVNEKLYVFTRQGTDETLLCLNAADGQEVWRNTYEAAPVTGPAARHPGPRSSPAVADGKIVTLGVTGVLSCVDITSGKDVWRKDPFSGAVPLFFTASSPIIADGLAIAQLGGDDNGGIIAFDLVSGDEKWRWTGEGPGYSSPVMLVVDGVKQIVALTDKSVVGVSLADGKLLWQLPFVPQGRSYNAATPIIEGQTVIYTGASRGAKAVKIEQKDDGFTATELWSNDQLAPQFNTPVLVNGMLFGLSERGNLYCLNAQNGQTDWTDSTNLQNFGAIVDVGADLMVLPQSGELTVCKADGKAFSEVAKYKVAETQTYATPVVSGKRIFVKDQESLTLWLIE
jgi:outer membrane protein assembly factor BamB